MSSARLVRNVLDSSQWLEVTEEQLLRVAVLKEVLCSASCQGRLWVTAVLLWQRRVTSWPPTHFPTRQTLDWVCTLARHSVSGETVRRIDGREKERWRKAVTTDAVCFGYLQQNRGYTKSVTQIHQHIIKITVCSVRKKCCRTGWLFRLDHVSQKQFGIADPPLWSNLYFLSGIFQAFPTQTKWCLILC